MRRMTTAADKYHWDLAPPCPPAEEHFPGLPGVKIARYSDRVQFSCSLPPTDDPLERAMREGRRYGREVFEKTYGAERLRRQDQIIRALHLTLVAAGYERLGSGVSRIVYAFGKNTVLKVPIDTNPDHYRANIREFRFWRKYRRRGVIKLAACRKLTILGVPCLVMQRVTVPGRNDCHKGDTDRRLAPVWAERLDGYQCALTARGEWVTYDYGYQDEGSITRPLSYRELNEEMRRSSMRAEAAE